MSALVSARPLGRPRLRGFRHLWGRGRGAAVALVVIAATFASLMTGGAHAAEVSNGLTVTPVGKIQEKTADGQCRSGSITEISGPADLVSGITGALVTAESHLPAGTITSHKVVDGKLRVTAYQDVPCSVNGSGAMVWLRPALADIAYTAAYVAITAAVMGFGYLKFGVPITDPRLEALAGCLAGGVGLAVNNAVNGLSNWREIVSSSVTGCLTGAALNLTIQRAGYYLINAVNWVSGAPGITYAVAAGEIKSVADFAAQRVVEIEAQLRVPAPE